jgi:hypothetical protein
MLQRRAAEVRLLTCTREVFSWNLGQKSIILIAVFLGFFQPL